MQVGPYSVAATESGVHAGPAQVVFVHGWAGTRAQWNRTIEALAADWHCVAVDMPGFGESGPPADDLSPAGLGSVALQIVTALNPNGVVLVGHSLGALVALEATRVAAGSGSKRLQGTSPEAAPTPAPAPTPIRGLVLISPPDPADLRVRTALFRTKMLGMPVAATFQVLGRLAARWRVPTGRGRAARWIRRRAQSVGTPSAVLFESARELNRAPSPVPLTGSTPVLVIVGDSDHTVSAEAGRRLAGESAACELVVVPRSGHHVMEAQPELFIGVLADWLARKMTNKEAG
jgi:pimeloyl-ACP methyl ester carboxylesterase